MSDSQKWPAIPKNEPPPPYAHLTVTSSGGTNMLSTAVKNAFQDAMALRGRLREDAFQIHGFSGKKTRLFFNNIMHELKYPRYLEIGLFHGASFCPSLFNNTIRAVGIDNWTEYGGQRGLFDKNLEAFRSDGTDVRIVEQDFRKVDYESLGKFNVMFYDGPHSEQDQYDGVTFPLPAMDQSFILIVDDWNWDRVRNASFRALRDKKMRIDYSVEVRTSFHGELPLVHGARSEWHNGMFCGVVTRE